MVLVSTSVYSIDMEQRVQMVDSLLPSAVFFWFQEVIHSMPISSHDMRFSSKFAIYSWARFFIHLNVIMIIMTIIIIIVPLSK